MNEKEDNDDNPLSSLSKVYPSALISILECRCVKDGMWCDNVMEEHVRLYAHLARDSYSASISRGGLSPKWALSTPLQR